MKHSAHLRSPSSRARSRRPSIGRGTFRFASLALVTSVLAGVLGSSPATAEEPAAIGVDKWDRDYIVRSWKEGGPGVRQAAEAALAGTDDDILTFLATEENLAQYHDERVAAGQMASTGGIGVREAAKKALLGSQDELEQFLIDGWKGPQEQDERIRVGQIISTGGNGVRDAGKAALLGSPADVQKFLDEGQYEARATDQRVEVGQIMAVGGPATKAAAKLALRGTEQDVAEFLATGQHVARARDGEQATLAQLAKQAGYASRLAQKESDQAVESALRAEAASVLAKQAAAKAAEETKAAGKDSVRAANAAARAAQAARGAAAEASNAIGAARAANAASRIAAAAAAAAASAATKAADAASRARSAAAAAASDAGKADDARKLAAAARKAADLADDSAAAADQAGKASDAADAAATAAGNAAGNAKAAADAADAANSHAAQAGASSDEARNAAAQARRHANEAQRAATASSALARKSATAAYESRDAARSAATHARNAADAADKAADHAGDASKAAAESAKHAAEANNAAGTAEKALTTAQQVFALARAAEEQELTDRTTDGVENAEARKKERDALNTRIAQSVQQIYSLDDEARSLSEEAAKPDTDPKALAAKGRVLAVKAMRNGDHGPWSQEAAAAALSGDDTAVVLYLRTGRGEAVARDTRFQVEQLAADSPYQAVRDAADQALTRNDEDIEAFLRNGQFEAAVTEYRIQVGKVHSTGGPGVKEAAKALLQENDPKKLATFLLADQYIARNTDERVRAGQLLSSGGPEVKSAARIALSGSADELHTFIQHGQYQADSMDQLTATHLAQTTQLIAETARSAANARAQAWRAQQTAARARKAEDEAIKAAEKAAESEIQASKYAADANKSATAAEGSAAKAAQSAATARQAAADANQYADNAEASAFSAQFSADYARNSAVEARKSADRAHASALEANKSKEEAAADANAAWERTERILRAELAEAKRQAEAEFKRQQQAEEDRRKRTCHVPYTERGDAEFLRCVKRNGDEAIIAGIEVPQFLQDLALEISGIQGVLDCLDAPAFTKCAIAFAEVIPAGKILKLRKLDKLEEVAQKVRLRKPPCPACFLAGTKVLMAGGRTKNIEDVQASDQVVATDPATGNTSLQQVTRQVITKDDKWFNEVTVSTPTGPETLNPTYEHPFWSPSEKAWIKAGSLEEGMTLLSPDSSKPVKVQTNRSYSLAATTYNLSVAGVHTYYVLAGRTPILVHNCLQFDPKVIGKDLPKFDGGQTTGFYTDEDGFILDLASGRDPKHKRLIEAVNKRLKDKLGHTYNSDRADHVEQKFAALMLENGIDRAEIVINNPAGPCVDMGGLGCDQVLNTLLGNRSLTVHWPDGKGGFESHTYGSGSPRRGNKK